VRGLAVGERDELASVGVVLDHVKNLPNCAQPQTARPMTMKAMQALYAMPSQRA
jgi:hypothetical protein